MDNKDRPAITTEADRVARMAQEGGLIPRRRPPLSTPSTDTTATSGYTHDQIPQYSRPPVNGPPGPPQPEVHVPGTPVGPIDALPQPPAQNEDTSTQKPSWINRLNPLRGFRGRDNQAPAGTLAQEARASVQEDAGAGNVEQHTGGAIYQPVVPKAWDPQEDPQAGRRLRGQGEAGGGNNQDTGRSTTDKIIPFLAEHKDKFFFVGSGLVLGTLARAMNVDPDILRGSIRIAAGAGGALAASGMSEYASNWIWARTPADSKLEKAADITEIVSRRLRQVSMMTALASGGVATEEFLSDPSRAIEALQQVPADLGGALAHPIDTLGETWDNLTDALTPEVPAATSPAPSVTPTVPETPTPTPIVTATATNTPDTGVTTSGTPRPSGTPIVQATPSTGVTPTLASPSPSPSPSPSASSGNGSSLPGSLPPIVDNPPGGSSSHVQLPNPVEHIKFGEDTGYQEKGPGFNDLPENKIDITPEYDFVINGNRVKGNLDNLTFNDKGWIIFENGEKNVDHLKQNHEIEGYHINSTRLKEELYPTIGLYGEKKLVPGTFEYKLFHFANGTGTEFQDIFEDPEFATDLKNRGILEIDRPEPTGVTGASPEEPIIPNHVDIDKGYIEKTSGFNDDPAVNPEAPHRDKYGVIVENVKLGENTGYQEKGSGYNDDPTTNQQAPRFDDPANLVDPDKGWKEQTSGFNDDPAVNPEAPHRDKYGIITENVKLGDNTGYIEKTSGFNDDPAVNPEATPYHKPLELTSPYGEHKISGSIYDGTLQWDGKDWHIFENGISNIKEATSFQGFNEAYYVDQEKYKGELERLITLWTKGELTNPEDKLIYYLSDGVGTEYDRVKGDPATIQALKDKGIIKTK